MVHPHEALVETSRFCTVPLAGTAAAALTTQTRQRTTKAAMKIVPTRIEEQISRVDRTRSLAIGITSGITVL